MGLFLKSLLFTVLVPGTFAVLIPYRLGLRRSGLPRLWTAQHYVSLLPFAIGAAISLRCVCDFAITGRGTPAPIDAPKVLVVGGLYRYVRNPMYIGVLLVMLGWTVFFNSAAVVVYAAGGALLFHLFVVLVEEPRLRRQFGEPYQRYCSAVRRWLPGTPYQGNS